MKVVFNCCPKPVLAGHKVGMPLFKGGEASPEIKTQPTQADTVEISTKPKTEEKPECIDCK